MFGLGDLIDGAADLAGKAIGTVAGIAVAPIAIALGVSYAAVKAAVKAGCRTTDQIDKWIRESPDW